MVRIDETELLEDPDLPDDLVERAYRDMAAIHRWLGDMRFVARAVRRDPLPVRRILDVGCGTGLVAHRIGRRLGIEAVGVDIRPRLSAAAPLRIAQADACCEPLPLADIAYCMNLCHHLDRVDVIRLIRNVGRYCRRFILLDLVRHPLPLALFRGFVAPWICRIDAEDGLRSIRRSYTPHELRGLAGAALSGTGAHFQSLVAPFRVRQVIDIVYGEPGSDEGTSVLAEVDECAS